MSVDHLKDQNAANEVPNTSDVSGHSLGDRDEVGAGTSGDGSSFGQAVLLAQQGYGWEDLTKQRDKDKPKPWQLGLSREAARTAVFGRAK